jgi:hypothetical protein
MGILFRDGRSAVGGAAVVMLAIAQTLTSCDSDSRNDSQSGQLRNGWVTNCAGPSFALFLADGSKGPWPDRPVFRVNDELVLAIPKENSPSANKLESQPSVCKDISDLPPVSYLTFKIIGNWSGDHEPQDARSAERDKQFRPDVVGVRLEREMPSIMSAQEQEETRLTGDKFLRENSIGVTETGDLTCLVPTPAFTFFSCYRHPSKPDSKGTRFRYRDYSSTPFILIQANYISPRYGHIHIHWTAWTLNISHALEIDDAIWKSIEEWNLLNKPAIQTQQP